MPVLYTNMLGSTGLATSFAAITGRSFTLSGDMSDYSMEVSYLRRRTIELLQQTKLQLI